MSTLRSSPSEPLEGLAKAAGDPRYEARKVLEAGGLSTIETHISLVFLGEQEVWKTKKSVDLGFLDFTTIERRLDACRAEVELNRRLAPGVYLGVVPLLRRRSERGRTETFFFGQPGQERCEGVELIDWAVHMRRLQERDRADVMQSEGRLRTADLRALAGRLAEFHRLARRDTGVEVFGSLDTVRRNVVENFTQVADSIDRYLSPAEVAEVEGRQLQFLDTRGALFERRIRDHRVRDGHGDLRLEHVYIEKVEARARNDGERDSSTFGDGSDAVPGLERKLSIVDCIEFNDRFRYADVCADVAFLAMDLAHHGTAADAERFLAFYAEQAQDFDLYAMVDFYESYRAFVRAKICLFALDNPGLEAAHREAAESEARRYFLLSLAAEKQPLARPRLLAVGGQIASGKSTVAQFLGDQLAAPVVSADRTRKALLGVAPEQPVHHPPFEGAYAPEMSSRVYRELLRRAEVVLASGRSVVLDASFRSREDRAAASALARRLDVPFLFVDCRAPIETLRTRLEERQRGRSVSDGRLEILDRLVESHESADELTPREKITVDTDLPKLATFSRLRQLVKGFEPQL